MSEVISPGAAATIVEVLAWWAKHRPDRRAFVFLERGEREAGSFTYAELDSRARVIARAVRANGLVGQRVVLAYPTCLEFVAALFGCFFAGAIAVPAPVESHSRAASRLQGIREDAAAAAVFSLRSMLSQCAAPGPIPNVLYLATDELPQVPDRTPPRPIESSAVALLQYTSGSTGNPRGVMLSHGNIINNQLALSAVLMTGVDDVVVNWLPLYHDMGLIGGVLHTVYFGGSCVLMPPLAFAQKPRRWLQAIGRYNASVSMAPCFAYSLVTQHGGDQGRASLDLSSWRVAICGGESVRPQVLERFAATFLPAGFAPKAFMPAYGLAESTLIAAASPAGTGLIAHRRAPFEVPEGDRQDGWSRELAYCGPAVKGQRIAIVEPATGRPVPLGQRGEIWLQGPSVAAGYWNRPEETQATFGARLADATDCESWLRSGDLGFMGADGLVITGRAKEIIVVRGANFDPLDLETSAYESDPAFETGGGAAFSVDHGDGEHIVLLHEVRRDAARTVDVNFLASKVIDIVNRNFGLKIYDLVLLRPRTLPRTTSGKIRRHACKEQYLAGGLAALDTIDHPGLGRCRPGTG